MFTIWMISLVSFRTLFLEMRMPTCCVEEAPRVRTLWWQIVHAIKPELTITKEEVELL
jgi:hypothetical protein